MITIVGLGPGDPGRIPQENLTILRSGRKVILRTSHHPTVSFLVEQGIVFESCDDLYDNAESFDELYASIADRVLSAGDCVYCVPGHPLFGEESVRKILERVECEVLGAPSFVEAVLETAKTVVSGALQVWNAYDLESQQVDPRCLQVIYNLDSKDVASRSKLWLLRFYPGEQKIIVVKGSTRSECQLAELDHGIFDPLTSVVIEPIKLPRPPGFYGLVSIVDTLLGPEGCPWDREQTHETLKKHLIEEAYETIEAIDSGDKERLCEELGDLLLQPLMHAQMDAIEGLYDIDDVIAAISEKLIRRHPHVFGEKEVSDATEVLANWDAIKRSEKPEERSILDGVPRSLPALLRAYEVSKRAARVGFEWPNLQAVLMKVDEEQNEFEAALQSGDQSRIEEEFGDLLFALVNVARWAGVEPEDALRKMIARFTKRFEEMERNASKPLRELTPEEWDELWERSKSPR